MLAQKLSVPGSDIKRYMETAISARDLRFYPQSSKQRKHYPRHPNGLLAGLKSGNEIRLEIDSTNLSRTLNSSQPYS